MSLFGTVQRVWMERSAKGKSYADLAEGLERDRPLVAEKFRGAKDSARNREAACHIIGIERWGQRRLRTLLGEPLVLDEYDGYRPDTSRTMAELADDFERARQESLALVQTLQAQGVPLTQTVVHNESGPMSVGAWLAYLRSHARRERVRIR